MNGPGPRHAKDREVSATALLRVLENIEHFAQMAKAELPVAIPAPSERPATSVDALGEPLDVRQAAALIGCSAWTVRQKYIPAGLPHFRSGPNGKLIFYKNQIINWLLEKQRKGGMGHEPL